MNNTISNHEKEYFEILRKLGDYVRYIIKENGLEEGVAYQLGISFMPVENEGVEMKTIGLIKFRAWHYPEERMIYTDWNSFRNWYTESHVGKVFMERGHPDENLVLSEPMMYLGLKDCKGNEIYHNDIFKYWMDNVWKYGVIEPCPGGSILKIYEPTMWNTGLQSFIPYPAKFITTLPMTKYEEHPNQMRDKFEVIGNKFKTPELLFGTGINIPLLNRRPGCD